MTHSSYQSLILTYSLSRVKKVHLLWQDVNGVSFSQYFSASGYDLFELTAEVLDSVSNRTN